MAEFPHSAAAGTVACRLPDGRVLMLDRFLANGTLLRVAGLVDAAGVSFARVLEVEYSTGPGGAVTHVVPHPVQIGKVCRVRTVVRP